jgi:hypothetical protein
MDLQDGHDARVEVIRLRRLGVVDVHRIPSSGYFKHRRVVPVPRELIRVERGAGDENLDVRTVTSDVFDQAEEDVGVQSALVGFVDDHLGSRERRDAAAARTVSITSSQQGQTRSQHTLSLVVVGLLLTHEYVLRSGSLRNSLSSIPSVIYLIMVFSEEQSSNRIVYPTSAPSFTFIS